MTALLRHQRGDRQSYVAFVIDFIATLGLAPGVFGTNKSIAKINRVSRSLIGAKRYDFASEPAANEAILSQ
jgi:hypothetical protein